jgi:site-specific DNA-cytosine methylase
VGNTNPDGAHRLDGMGFGIYVVGRTHTRRMAVSRITTAAAIHRNMGISEDIGQISLEFETGTKTYRPNELEVLDLFAGIGGFALGFKAAKFAKVTGVDVEPVSERVFSKDENGIGAFELVDLRNELVNSKVQVLVGGPPCRPWSSVNLQRRREAHGDYTLLERFFLHVREIEPEVFLMENVPPLVGDPKYKSLVEELRKKLNYSVLSRVLKYSEFGSATARRRLFTVGLRDSVKWGAV